MVNRTKWYPTSKCEISDICFLSSSERLSSSFSLLKKRLIKASLILAWAHSFYQNPGSQSSWKHEDPVYPESIENSAWVFTSPPIWLLVPYIHSRATTSPFTWLPCPGLELTPPTPIWLNQMAQNLCCWVSLGFLGQVLQNEGQGQADYSDSSQEGNPRVMRECEGIRNVRWVSPKSREKRKTKHFTWLYIKI